MINWANEYAKIINCQHCNIETNKSILRDSFENVPQPGYIGSKYEESHILLIGQNPGVGNINSEQKAQPYLKILRQLRDSPSSSVFEKLQKILEGLIPTWPVHGNYFPLIESRLSLNEIAYINVVRCRTQENKSPTVGMVNNCYSHLENWIKLLKPNAIIFIGKWASDKGTPIADKFGIPHKYMNRLRSLSNNERQKNRSDVAKFVRTMVG